MQIGHGIVVDVDSDGHPAGIDVDEASRQVVCRQLVGGPKHRLPRERFVHLAKTRGTGQGLRHHRGSPRRALVP